MTASDFLNPLKHGPRSRAFLLFDGLAAASEADMATFGPAENVLVTIERNHLFVHIRYLSAVTVRDQSYNFLSPEQKDIAYCR